jgi:hypothetical protein
VSASAPAATASASRERRIPLTPYQAGGRVSVSDLIVICGGIVLLIAGWALQRAHDARLETTDVAGLQVAHPEGWLPLPVVPPARAQWTDNQGLGATLTLYAEPLGEAGIRRGSANPAESNAAYTPLRSEPDTIGDIPVIRSDYAFARQQLAASTVPEIVRGREVAWTANGERYALALEAPERDWNRVAPLFDNLANATVTAGGAG